MALLTQFRSFCIPRAAFKILRIRAILSMRITRIIVGFMGNLEFNSSNIIPIIERNTMTISN